MELTFAKILSLLAKNGGAYHSLVRRLWCRWFILTELLSQKRGEAEERALSEEGREAKPEMNAKSKRRLEALSRRYPGKLELRVPQGATPVTLRMQALTAVRYDDILAHVTFTGTGSKDSRLYSLWDQTQVWDPGDWPPPTGQASAGAPQQTDRC
jgi:hypothetical protein